MTRLYATGDFSGIQGYVLDVKTAGNRQAQRLRARSFLVELFERAALFQLERRFGVAEDDVLVRGGGGFTVRLPADADTGELERFAADMQQRLWRETGGEVQFALGWGYDTAEKARNSLERQKRRPALSLLQRDNEWAIADADGAGATLPAPGECDVCGHSRGPQVRRESDEDPEKTCPICVQAARIGGNLTWWNWMRPEASDGGVGTGAADAEALGVKFSASPQERPGAFRAGRWVPRHADGRRGLRFSEIAAESRGDPRLAVLKADVDDMGMWVGEVAARDETYGELRRFSRRLHSFFVDEMQDLLARSYPLIYTIYAGGDDLLLVGPWDTTLDFVGCLQQRFQSGPGQEYGITFSAGIHLTPHDVPIRYAVEHAEDLLEQAKDKDQEGKNRCSALGTVCEIVPGLPGRVCQSKNRCAALGTIWHWERHSAIIRDGKRLAQSGAGYRSLLHRLLQLAVDDSTERGLRAARWSYQVERNVPQGRNASSAAVELRGWAQKALRFFDEPPGFIPYKEQDELAARENRRRLEETAASLRYALLATRAGGGDGQ